MKLTVVYQLSSYVLAHIILRIDTISMLKSFHIATKLDSAFFEHFKWWDTTRKYEYIIVRNYDLFIILYLNLDRFAFDTGDVRFVQWLYFLFLD